MTKLGMVSAATSGMLAMAMAAIAPMAVSAQGNITILKPAAMEKLMPTTVFYRGQSATTQLRNSGGVKFGDGYYVLTSLVDTSGYSSATAAKYQAYFITEVPIQVGGMQLGAGAYGVGFIAGGKFVVTDVGGHDVLTVDSSTDNNLKRPMPLEVVADGSGGFRLYMGRKYVVMSR
jgi:hypothetical protein